MTYLDFLKNLDPEGLEAYAARAGTTPGYIKTHIASCPPRKIPRRILLRNLWRATGGVVEWREFLTHFYGAQPSSGKDEAAA